jgi:hypothetical protein
MNIPIGNARYYFLGGGGRSRAGAGVGGIDERDGGKLAILLSICNIGQRLKNVLM